jgi:uncharacterized protein YdhG (YjbR/CyaY superfamily)
MSAEEIDEHLTALDEPKRPALEALRRSILDVVPDAEQHMSHGVPGFRVNGTVVAGFVAAKNHLNYFPHSGEVLEHLQGELAGYEWAKGTLRFPIDEPLPDDLVKRLLGARIAETRSRGGSGQRRPEEV